MFFLRKYLSCCIFSLLLLSSCVFANYDLRSYTENCSSSQASTRTGIVPNGTCNVTLTINGTDTVTVKRHFDPATGPDHITRSGCNYSGGWYVSSVGGCWPTYSCIGTPANAYMIPGENTPYTLSHNYTSTVVPANTANLCEYMCNP